MKLTNPNSLRVNVAATSNETWHFRAEVRDGDLGGELANAYGRAHDGFERVTVTVGDPFGGANRALPLAYSSSYTAADGAKVDVFEADVFMSSRYGNNRMPYWARVDTNVGSQHAQEWGEDLGALPPRR